MRVLLALTLLAVASLAHGALYKCSSDKDRVIYQDTACPPGRELRNLDMESPNLSVVPGTPVPGRGPAASLAAKPDRSVTREPRHSAKRGDPAERRFIHTGMTEGEVIGKIGRPDVEAGGKNRHARRWTYFPAEGDGNTVTMVTIVGGKVTDVERRVSR